MTEQERILTQKISQKVRAWFQPMTDGSGTDPYLTAAIMQIADKRAEDFWTVGLAENARLSWEIQDIRTNLFLLLFSVVKPAVVKERIRESEAESMVQTFGRLRGILLEEAESIPTSHKVEFDGFINRWFPVVKAR